MNFIVVDLEATCGWINENRQSEIIEIGAVKLNEKLETVDEFQSFIRPVINPELTEFCTKLTSIKQSDVDNAKGASEVLTNFARWCGVSSTNKPSVPFWLCSWGHYDKNQIRQDCQHWGISTDWTHNHISIKHQHGTIIGEKRGIGMERALAMYGLKLDGTHHRAISDARNTVKLFIHLFDNLKFEEGK